MDELAKSRKKCLISKEKRKNFQIRRHQTYYDIFKRENPDLRAIGTLSSVMDG